MRPIELVSRLSPLVLGNHGLVICAENCSAAEHLLVKVEKSVELRPRPLPKLYSATAKASIAGPGWFVPDDPAIQALATDPISHRILSGGFLYPCQAIFLPSTVRVLEQRPGSVLIEPGLQHEPEFWPAHARANFARRDLVTARLEYARAVQMAKSRADRNAIEAELKSRLPPT